MKITIRQKLLSVTFIVLLPLLVVSGLSYYMMVSATRHESSAQIRSIATDVARGLDELFDKSFRIMDAVASHPSVQKMDPKGCDALFAKLLPSYPLHLNILAARMDGFNAGSAVSSPDVHRLNYLDKEWFQQSSAGKRIVGDLHISKLFRAPAIMIATPVYGDDGTRRGVLGFPLNLNSIRSNIIRHQELPSGSTVMVVDGRGNVLVDTLRPERIGTDSNETPVIAASRKTNNTFLEMTAGDGAARLYYVTSPAATDWRVIVGVPSSVLTATALKVNGRYLAVILLATLLGLSLSLVIGRRITDNIARIATAIKAIGNNRYDYRLDLRGNDELAEIAGYFNAMTQERQRHEQELKRAALQWQTTFDAAHDLYLLLDRTCTIVRVNRAATEFLGLSEEEIVGRDCFRVINGLAEPPPECPFTRMLSSRRHEEAEIWNETRGIWMSVSVDPLYDEAGNLVQVVEIIRDITERKRVEHAFQTQFRQMSMIFDEMSVIVHVVDPETMGLVYLNRYGTTIFGDSWEGKLCYDVIRCGEPRPCLIPCESALQDGDSDRQRRYIYKNEMTGRWYQCLEKPITWVDGKAVVITLATDITDLKATIQVKEDLLSAVSHEMKTPLTAICGYAEFLLENKVKTAQRQEFLTIILKESRRLDDVVDNFLILQRLRGNVADDQVEPVDLRPFLQETADIFARTCSSHRIIIEIPPSLPQVRIRDFHLRVLLNNLLSNAVKYSPHGGRIVVRAHQDVPAAVTLSVRDEGIGISPHVHARIFDRFYQVESGDRRGFGGIGLGLALVKEIAESYSGSVRVESLPGKGSTFFVSVPADGAMTAAV